MPNTTNIIIEASISSSTFISVLSYANKAIQSIVTTSLDNGENIQTTRSSIISSEEPTISYENQVLSFGYVHEVSTIDAAVNSALHKSYNHSIQSTSSQSDFYIEVDLTIPNSNDDQQINKSYTLTMPLQSYNDTYVWIVNDEQEVKALQSSNQFLSTAINSFNWEEQNSSEYSSIELPLHNTLNSSMKRYSQQGTSNINFINATDASSESLKTSLVSSIESNTILATITLNTTKMPVIHSGNILNFVSPLLNRAYELDKRSVLKLRFCLFELSLYYNLVFSFFNVNTK